MQQTWNCPQCGEEFEVGLYVEPDEPNYGADADGNRGVFMAGYLECEEYPETCPHCGYTLTEGDVEAITEHFTDVLRERDAYDGPDTLAERE